MSNKPSYTYSIAKTNNGDDVLVIVERFEYDNPTITVTNGVETVLSDIKKSLNSLPEFIVYRDSEGEWDGIKATSDGRFQGFYSLSQSDGSPTLTQQMALKMVGN